MTFDEQERYVRALETCHTDKLRIDASRFDRQGARMDRIRGSRTIEGIRRTLSRIMMDQDVGLIVVDHLQRIEPPFPCPIFERVTQASNGLAEIAQEFGIPVVAMLQLNEGKEAPTSTDTRGGQEIGNDCQALILLDRPPMRRAQKEQDRLTDFEKEEAELIVALHGSGATGTIPMRYAGAHMRWYQASEWMTSGGHLMAQ
jgi:replicative DNA helicase